MKDLKNLKGAKMLNKMEQKTIKGGWRPIMKICGGDSDCPEGYCCQYTTPEHNSCVPGTGCQV